jgi:hypothetical protein
VAAVPIASQTKQKQNGSENENAKIKIAGKNNIDRISLILRYQSS